jgi:mono/diheme cytochrome c family protein
MAFIAPLPPERGERLGEAGAPPRRGVLARASSPPQAGKREILPTLARLLGAAVLLLTAHAPARAQSTVDVNQLFATTCGWCHSDGGRAAGRGPQLMGTTRTDSFIRYRVKHGKEGAMPAFASLSDAELDAIVAYIRALKPESK